MSSRLPKMFKLSSELDMKKILECPGCDKIPYPPIYLCDGGHHICNSCKTLQMKCILCGKNISELRDATLEKMVAGSKHTCPYKEDGCKLVATGPIVETHIGNCQFQPIVCPMTGQHGCSESSLKLSHAVLHLQSLHQVELSPDRDGGLIELSVPATMFEPQVSGGGSRLTATIINYDRRHFLFQVSPVKETMCWTVTFIGSDAGATQYCVDMIAQPGQVTKMQWSAPVQSVHQTVVQRQTDFDEMYVPSCMLKNLKFMLGDQLNGTYKLKTSVKLSKAQ